MRQSVSLQRVGGPSSISGELLRNQAFSESRVSGYYKNDIPRWRSGKYKRLAVENGEPL